MAALRYRVAVEPGDLDARLALARAQRRDAPGAALTHFGVVARNRSLSAADRAAMATLLIARARQRLAVGDAWAIRDLERARSLGIAVEPDLWGRSLALAIVARARHRETLDGRSRGWLAALRDVAPDHPLVVLGDAEAASVAEVGRAGAFLAAAGAKRVALRLLREYVRRGGREHGDAYLAMESWWGGRSGLPDEALIAELGGEPCALALTPRDLGCERELGSIARSSVTRARGLRARAADLHWRTADPHAAGAWTMIALQVWVAGDVDDWLGELAARVDLHGLRGSLAPVDEPSGAPGMVAPMARVPGYARATLLRVVGEQAAAARALEAAVEEAGRWSARERAVLVAELAVRATVDWPAIERVSAAGPIGDEGHAVAAAAARAAGDIDREKHHLAAMEPAAAWRYLWTHGDLGALAGYADGASPMAVAWGRAALARWRQRAAPDERRRLEARWRQLAAGTTVPPVAVITAPPRMPGVHALVDAAGARPDDAAALARIARAHLRDPAIAARLAEAYIDGAVYLGDRGPLVAQLYARLGDPARALALWQRIADATDRPDNLLALGAAAAAAGDFERALVHFVAAAARSGDAGATSTEVARVLLRAGAPVQALEVGRRALALTAPGRDQAALSVVRDAMLMLERYRDAAEISAALVERAPAPFRDAARAEVRAAWPADAPRAALDRHVVGPGWRGAAALAQAARGEMDVRKALAMRPRSLAVWERALSAGVAPRAQLIALIETSDDRDWSARAEQLLARSAQGS